MSIATTSAVSVATTLSVGAGNNHSRCIECEQPYYRNRYYRRQFESLVQSVLDSFRRERRRRDRRRLSIGGYPDVKAAIDGKQPNLTNTSDVSVRNVTFPVQYRRPVL
jgi:hypothetical protein